jgi:hypothetical protein
VSFDTAAVVLVPAVVLYAAGWVTGNYLLTLAVGRAGRLPDSIGLPERALAAMVGAVCFSVALMLVHIATGGRIFGNPWPVPVAGLAVLVAGLRGRMWPRSIPWSRVAVAAAILFLLSLFPVVVAGSGVRTGDPPWHLGWSNQLLSGEALPSGPAPEFSRNAYPWGFHAVLATMARLVPGSNPLIAHEGLHLLLVAAVPLAAACLARLINRRAGWAAAAAASLFGGFGWIQARGPRFALSPTRANFGADLVVASPNSIYELLPPAFPRELGLVVVAAAAVLVAHTVTTARPATAIAAGVAVGVAGLVSLPMLVLGFLWLLAGLAVGTRVRKRARLWLLATGSALGTAGLWLIPVAVSYVRFGGFLEISPALGVEWPLPTALGSWGLLLPLAAVGVVLIGVHHRVEIGARVVMALTGATVVLLVAAMARGRLEWTLGSNPTLLHQGRVWPAAHLLGAAFAGVALLAAFEWVRTRSGRGAVIAVGLVMAVGAVSPVFASIHLTRVMNRYEKGFIYGREDFDQDAFVLRAASELSARDVVRVHGSDFLGFLLFQFSGARLASYDDPRLNGNDLRIRFADLAAEWEQRVRGAGFVANYTALPEADAPAGVAVVARGTFREEPWILVTGEQ